MQDLQRQGSVFLGDPVGLNEPLWDPHGIPGGPSMISHSVTY